MIGQELRIEQLKTAADETPDQMNEGHLAGIPLAGKHALAEERAAHRNAIEAAHKLSLAPAFDGMGIALSMQFAVNPPDIAVDPGFRPSRSGFGTSRDHRVERGIRSYFKAVAPNRAGEAPGHMELIESDDPPFVGAHPEDTLSSPALRHWKKPGGIGPKQQFGCECGLAHTS